MTEHLLDGVLVRAATYLALALCIGPVCWSWWCEPQARFELPRRRAVAIGALLAIAILLEVVHATLTFTERWSWSGAAEVLRTTDYGHRVAFYALACVAQAGAALSARRIAIALASAITAVALARIGHAATGTTIDIAVHVLHVLAASAWVGGLWIVVQRTTARTLGLPALLRFSRLAGGLVAMLAATGLARTLAVASTLDIASSWSLALALKLGMVGVALLIALGHRRTRIPQLRASGAAWPRMEAMATLELWFVLCALLVAGLLSQLDPP